jgi:hypothetical protein
MILPLTPAQFLALKGALATAQGVTLTQTSATAGTLRTSDVLLDYTYDGTASLGVLVVKKFSLAAKFAPESVIDSHISEMFNQYVQGATNG